MASSKPRFNKTPEEKPPTKPRFTYDIPFQLRMIRVLYQDADYAHSVGRYLSPDHFEKRHHRWVVERILDFVSKHNCSIPKTALKTEMQRARRAGRLQEKDEKPLARLISKLDSPVKEKTYIKEELFGFVKNQVTREMILASLDHLDQHDFNAIDHEVNKVLEVSEAMTEGIGTYLVRDIKARTKRRRSYERNGIPTGIKIDDYHKHGGHRPKELAVILAPPGSGKTGTLVHIGRSAVIETGGACKVLHVTLELGQDVMEDRYDSAFSGVPLNMLERKRGTVARKIKNIGAKYGESLVIKEFPPATITVPTLRGYVRQLERNAFYPGLIIVDYADLLLASKITDSSYEDGGNIYTELRKMAVELKVPVWTVSQANRAALNKETITIDSLAESYKKAMIADWIVALCQTQEEKRRKIARFFIAKNRNGTQDIETRARVEWHKQRIRNL